MRTRALTASEANARLIELGFSIGLNTIQDNEYTLPFGTTTYTYANPSPNPFGPCHLYWESVGVKFSIGIEEDYKGNSNILLLMFNGCNGKAIANYNKMKAAEKKAFMEMAENAIRIEFPKPQALRDGFRDAKYMDEHGCYHTAFYDPFGNYCDKYSEFKKYESFYPGEHYEYNATPIIKK